MKSVRNRRGIVMVVARWHRARAAAADARAERQTSTLTGALSAQLANAFYLADGAAYHALGDPTLYVPDNTIRQVDLSGGSTAMNSSWLREIRAVPIPPATCWCGRRTARCAPPSSGRRGFTGKMYSSTVDGVKNPTNAGIDPKGTRCRCRPRSRVPCAIAVPEMRPGRRGGPWGSSTCVAAFSCV